MQTKYKDYNLSYSTDCVARLRELIRINRRLTIREVSVAVWLSYGTTDARFEHATCCCKICSANSFSRTDEMALVCCNKHAAGSRVRWSLYGANNHGRWEVGLRVWPRDETSVFVVEVCFFPEAKWSALGAVKSQFMLIVFFICTALFTMSKLHKTQL